MVLNINEYFENERKRREEGKNDLVKYTYERFKALDVPVELNENGLFLNGDRVVPISTEVFTLPDICILLVISPSLSSLAVAPFSV